MSPEEKEKHAEDLNADDAGRRRQPNCRGPAEEDLPPGLKAIEAELASLVPRTDRLDRERLIFLAGQQSVSVEGTRDTKGTVPFSLRENRDSPRTRWAWPAAFAAMTAVAAALLVMLLLQPDTPAAAPVAELPGEPAGNGNVASGESPATTLHNGEHVESPPGETDDWRQVSAVGSERLIYAIFEGLMRITGRDTLNTAPYSLGSEWAPWATVVVLWFYQGRGATPLVPMLRPLRPPQENDGSGASQQEDYGCGVEYKVTDLS